VAELLVELKSYVGWSEDDAARLRALEPVLRPRFAGFADHFYEVIARHPRAAAIFTGGAAQIERLRAALVDWMSSGLLGPHDGEFHARRSKIGERHVAIGLPQEYMFTAVDVLRLDYHAAIAELVPAADVVATIGSVDKLFDIELAIMLRHYQLASEAGVIDRERILQTDKLTAMQTLSAGLAHEVRNPLNAARLQLEVLERRLRRGADDRVFETVEQIEQEMSRLTHLLNEFLAFAQPPPLEPAPHDLVLIAHDAVELEHGRAEAAGVPVTIACADPRVLANVDGAHVLQIIRALVRNAIEATPSGGEVTVELRVANQLPSVRVVDRGSGIPPGARARIFEPFFSTKPEGTGMGLALVHSLVGAHAGTVEVETELGRGTTFTVTLPPA
jgi:signal transduction histidine kinase